MVGFAAGSREKIEALRVNWNEETRQRYASPEAVAAVFLADLVTGHDSFRVLESRVTDPAHATVSVTFDAAIVALRLPLQRMPDGWQLWITDELGDELVSALRGARRTAGRL
jgi:hypothetical protein